MRTVLVAGLLLTLTACTSSTTSPDTTVVSGAPQGDDLRRDAIRVVTVDGVRCVLVTVGVYGGNSPALSCDWNGATHR